MVLFASMTILQLRESGMDSEIESDVTFLGFTLCDCLVEVDAHLTKYLRAVHRTALELAIQNKFGQEVGGFWLMPEQIAQLRNLSAYYPPNEAILVQRVIEAYLHAQLEGFDSLIINSHHLTH